MKREIKRSKTQRAWNKYKKLIYLGIAIVIVFVIIIVLVTKAIGGATNKTEAPTTTEETSEQTTPVQTEPESTTMETTTEEPTTVAPTSISKTPTEEEFTNEDFFADSIFVGDTFIAAIDLYGFIDSSKLIFDTNWTVGKAVSNALTKVASSNASKVFIEIGINDLNNPKTGQAVYETYKELIDGIKEKLPNATIYVMSVFPITTEYESKDTVYILNSEVTILNDLLSQTEGITFLNINNSIANSDGSLISDLTTDGLHIKKAYMGFILNLVAEMCQ